MTRSRDATPKSPPTPYTIVEIAKFLLYAAIVVADREALLLPAEFSQACFGHTLATRRYPRLHESIDVLGAPRVDCAPSGCDYRALRRYLERRPAAPLKLAQIDPLIRQLSHDREQR